VAEGPTELKHNYHQKTKKKTEGKAVHFQMSSMTVQSGTRAHYRIAIGITVCK
jgi:hypothetical protein